MGLIGVPAKMGKTPQIWPTIIPAQPSTHPEPYWRSLHYFNLYRLTLAGLFVVGTLMMGPSAFGAMDAGLFLAASIVYAIFAAALSMSISLRWPRFKAQLALQICADIFFIVLLMSATGGVRGGLGLLLIVSLATTGLIGQGKMAMFYASLAVIAVLTEQSYRTLFLGEESGAFLQTGLLSMGFFATALLAHYLARRVVASERVAIKRGVDLANLAQINQLVIQDMQDGVLVVDAKNRVRQRNLQAEKLLGVHSVNRPQPNLQDYSSALTERLRRWRENPEVKFDPLRVLTTNRQLRTRFVGVDKDRSLGTVIFLEDLSTAQTQAQQLKLAALGRLTANIAHEIRNPLSAISHATELLQEEAGQNETQMRLLEIIRDNGHRLDRMVEDVLQLNRSDHAQGEELRLDLFIDNFSDQFCQFEKLPRTAISTEIDSELTICFDRNHLNQILWNLCRNAWRHSKKGDNSIRICAAAAHLEATIQIDVIDDGPGVDPALRHQLFEPFFTTSPSGTGLGLFIAREICEANGASLDYIEVAPGGQFRICCKAGGC